MCIRDRAYQDVIIPDSRKIAECLSKAICPEGVFIKIDFTDVECPVSYTHLTSHSSFDRKMSP